MKTILVTGANGSVGTEIICQLYKNYDIIVVGHSFSNLMPYINNIKCIKADIRDRDALTPIFKGVDYVIHLAAKVHVVPKNDKEAEEFFKVNTEATKNIFELCIQNKVKKVFFFSTIAVYGGYKGLISENTEVNPITPYARSKYQAEEIGQRMVKENGLPLCIIRPATIFGNLDRGNYGSLISLCKKGLSVVPGRGQNMKPIIYVKDVAKVVANLLEKDIKPGEVFILSQNNYSYIDIIGSIENVFNIKTLKIYVPLFIIKLLNLCLRLTLLRKLLTLSESIQVDNSKMLDMLGNVLDYDFVSGLEDSKEYYNRL